MKNQNLLNSRIIGVLLATFILFYLSSCDILPHGGGPILEKVEVTTLVSDFAASDGLSIDSSGNIYASNFAAFTGTEVLKTNPNTGVTEVIVDSLVAPTGNVIDRNGNIYIVNNIRFLSQEEGTTQADVLKVSPDGNREVIATLPGFPAGITLDKFNNAYVSNFSFPGVHKISPTGEVSIFVQDDRLLGGVGIVFDNRKNLFVGNFSSGNILKISPDKNVEVFTTLPTVTENVVIGYITYFAGSIYATAIGEHVIYKISMSGEASIFAGSGTQATTDGDLEEASFNTPNGITSDLYRKRIYVSEGDGNGALRVIQL